VEEGSLLHVLLGKRAFINVQNDNL